MSEQIVLRLLRNSIHDPAGVFGHLTHPDEPGALDLVTVEDDWRDNAPGESCIPPSPDSTAWVTYQLRRSWYHGGGYEAFQVMHVPGRSRILIHIANTEENVKGCIGVGLRFGPILVPTDEDTGAANVEKHGVVASREAYRRFMEYLADVDKLALQVGWAP